MPPQDEKEHVQLKKELTTQFFDTYIGPHLKVTYEHAKDGHTLLMECLNAALHLSPERFHVWQSMKSVSSQGANNLPNNNLYTFYLSAFQIINAIINGKPDVTFNRLLQPLMRLFPEGSEVNLREELSQALKAQIMEYSSSRIMLGLNEFYTIFPVAVTWLREKQVPLKKSVIAIDYHAISITFGIDVELALCLELEKHLALYRSREWKECQAKAQVTTLALMANVPSSISLLSFMEIELRRAVFTGDIYGIAKPFLQCTEYSLLNYRNEQGNGLLHLLAYQCAIACRSFYHNHYAIASYLSSLQTICEEHKARPYLMKTNTLGLSPLALLLFQLPSEYVNAPYGGEMLQRSRQALRSMLGCMDESLLSGIAEQVIILSDRFFAANYPTNSPEQTRYMALRDFTRKFEQNYPECMELLPFKIVIEKFKDEMQKLRRSIKVPKGSWYAPDKYMQGLGTVTQPEQAVSTPDPSPSTSPGPQPVASGKAEAVAEIERKIGQLSINTKQGK